MAQLRAPHRERQVPRAVMRIDQHDRCCRTKFVCRETSSGLTEEAGRHPELRVGSGQGPGQAPAERVDCGLHHPIVTQIEEKRI
jgi:hypothetical protein